MGIFTTIAASFASGDHVCLFYRDPTEQVSMIGPFLQAGLRANERCLAIQTPIAKDQLATWLNERGIDVAKEVERGALVFMDPAAAYPYRPDGSLDQHAMLRLIAKSLEEAISLGFTGFRPTGEVVWDVAQRERCGQLEEYENILAHYLPGKRITGICQYDLTRFKPEQLCNILSAHQFALLGGELGQRTLRVRRGTRFADVTFNEYDLKRFRYAVQEDGSSELIATGDERNFFKALSEAKSYLTKLHF